MKGIGSRIIVRGYMVIRERLNPAAAQRWAADLMKSEAMRPRPSKEYVVDAKMQAHLDTWEDDG